MNGITKAGLYLIAIACGCTLVLIPISALIIIGIEIEARIEEGNQMVKE